MRHARSRSAIAGSRSGRGWYEVVRIRPSELDADRTAEVQRELADVYAAAHGAPEAVDHFLSNRKLGEFRDIYTARADGELVAWFGVHSFDLDGRRVETLDDAVVDPRFHRRGLTRAITIGIYRQIALRGLREPVVVAVLTTNPIVADALESHLRPEVALYPAISTRSVRDPGLEAIAPAIAARLHADAPFDPATGVLSDFLPQWHIAAQECSDPLVRDYFERHLSPGSAVLVLLEIDRRMVVRHLGELVRKAAQTTMQRRRDTPPAAR